MPNTLGYWTRLDEVNPSDTGSNWIQALPVGTYNHPIYGVIEVTPERVQRMAANVNNNVRGTDLDIDYDHKDKSGEAAGWVKQADARADGLWLLVEWTNEALAKIKNRAYRYFSPEFADEWKHPRTGEKYEDVIFGGALTNRPFLKDILPINLSEIFKLAEDSSGSTTSSTGGSSSGSSGPSSTTNQGGNVDFMQKVALLLGLDENASEDAVVDALRAKIMGKAPTPDREPDRTPDRPPAGPPVPVRASDQVDDKVRQLAEENPGVKSLLERLDRLEDANRLSEVSLKLAELNGEDRKFVVAPAVLDEVKTLAVSSPKQLGDKLLELIGKFTEGAGLVQLGEDGHTTQTTENTASKQFTDKVEALTNGEKKMNYAEAVELVAAQEPELYDQYREETYAWKNSGGNG